ncbi:MAG: NAD(P)/FAD-dependent oxidoreductase, partial [Planctomycetota bacterium]|nr:NAD(P)/FAD-dependent oxidoreductase [Planctomycetota bacterium]
MSGVEPRRVPLVVLGGGPGGYPCAFAAADAGLEVVVVDDSDVPGGTCLRNGCIPSKALLHISRVISEAADAREAGITFSEPLVDLDRLREWKNEVVMGLAGGVSQLASAREVEWISAKGQLLDEHTLSLTTQRGEQSLLEFDRLVVATGSSPVWPSQFPRDTSRLMDSTAALDLPDLPARLLVVGGGYIGLELGTVFSSLGSNVTVVEMAGDLLAGADRDLVRPLRRHLESQFEAIRTNTSVESLAIEGDQVNAVLQPEAGGQESATFDGVLVAVGRKPNSEGVGLAEAGVDVDGMGHVVTDEHGQTTRAHIYAVGDVCDGPMLAHRATADARRVVSSLMGHSTPGKKPRVIPAVVFTDPEVAWCGMTETEAKSTQQVVEVVRVPWVAAGRAHAVGRTD